MTQSVYINIWNHLIFNSWPYHNLLYKMHFCNILYFHPKYQKADRHSFKKKQHCIFYIYILLPAIFAVDVRSLLTSGMSIAQPHTSQEINCLKMYWSGYLIKFIIVIMANEDGWHHLLIVTLGTRQWKILPSLDYGIKENIQYVLTFSFSKSTYQVQEDFNYLYWIDFLKVHTIQPNCNKRAKTNSPSHLSCHHLLCGPAVT